MGAGPPDVPLRGKSREAPIDASLSREARVEIRGTSALVDDGELRFNCGTAYSVFPEGTKLRTFAIIGVDGVSASPTVASVSLEGAYANLSLVYLNEREIWAPPGAKIQVELLNGKAATFPAPPIPLASCIRLKLRDVENGPLRFEEERESKTRTGRDRLVVYDALGSPPKTWGNGSKLADIDWIALEDAVEKPAKVCNYVNKANNHHERSFEFTRHDAKVTLYDRRSGRTIDTKTWINNAACPTEVTKKKTDYGADGFDYAEYVDSKITLGWVESHITR